MVSPVSKEELRRQFKKQFLKSFDSKWRIERSSIISGQLHQLFLTLEPIISSRYFCLGVYDPLEGEVQWSLGKDYASFQLALPVASSHCEMVYKATDFENETRGESFGILMREPRVDAPILKPDILLVPALAFNRDGYRLGRGQGFFDRYLKSFKGVSIGLIFDEQIKNFLPYEDHDVAVDYVVSESGFLKGKGNKTGV